jgi:mono/diheme cytochrome c family protein
MLKTRTIIAVVVAVLLVATAAFASATWSKLFNDTYKPKPGSAIVKAKCQLCHTKGVALNTYGSSLKGKKIEAASLKAVERLDSDKDKFSNISEIKAGKLPGDPKSKPAGKPKK